MQIPSSSGLPSGDGGPIVRAQAWRCPLPLPYPVRLGAIEYLAREYVVLRIVLASGQDGWSAGYSRGTDLLGSLRAVAPHLKGADPVTASRMLREEFSPGWQSLARGASLFDIAWWDALAVQRAVPVSVALGGRPRALRLAAVAGYFEGFRPLGEILDEVDRFVCEGYSTVKVMLPGRGRARDRELVDAVAARLPSNVELAVDLHGMYSDDELDVSVSEALAHVEALGDRAFGFIEDPFPTQSVRGVRRFARASATPTASGEDANGSSVLAALVEDGVGVLRVDATTAGGLTTLEPAIRTAENWGVRILPHVWPHVHGALAGLSLEIDQLEVIPSYVGADPIWMLLEEEAPIENGLWRSDGAGPAMPFSVGKVAAYAAESWEWSRSRSSQ